MEEINKQFFNFISNKNDFCSRQFNILQQNCGFYSLTSKDKFDPNEVDLDFKRSYKVTNIIKKINPQTGKMEDYAQISYPATPSLPLNLPRNLLKKLLIFDSKSLKDSYLQDFKIIQQISNTEKEEDQQSQEQSEEEEEEEDDNQNEGKNCEWTQLYKFCQTIQKQSQNKIKILNLQEFENICQRITQKLIIIEEKNTLPRGELFLKLKHLSEPGISFIKYDNRYLITFEDVQQLMITFTRLFLDNYQPKLDNNLFQLFKKANQIAKIAKINQEKNKVEEFASKQIKKQQIERKQSLDDFEDIKSKKKIQIQEAQEDYEQLKNSDSESLKQIDSDKQNYMKDESSHNINLSKDTAETNIELIQEKQQQQTNEYQNEKLIQEIPSPPNQDKQIQQTLSQKATSNQTDKEDYQKIIYPYQFTIRGSLDKWKIDFGNDYCHRVVKNKKCLNSLKNNESDDILKFIKKYHFKSFEELYREHQVQYDQIYVSHHKKDFVRTQQLKDVYKKKFKKFFRLLKQKFQLGESC